MEEIDHFYRNQSPLVALALTIIFLVCAARRKSPWSVVLWLPAVVLTGACTLLLIRLTFGGGHGGGPDAGWVGMANSFRLLFALPVIIAFFLFLFVFPRAVAWRPRYVLAGIVAIVLTPVALGTWFQASKPTITFRVTDAGGLPLSGIELSSEQRVIASSGSDGIVRISFSHTGIFSGVFSAPGYQQHTTQIQLCGLRGEMFCVYHTWSQHTGDEYFFNLDQKKAEYPSNQPATIPIEMRSELQNPKHPNGA